MSSTFSFVEIFFFAGTVANGELTAWRSIGCGLYWPRFFTTLTWSWQRGIGVGMSKSVLCCELSGPFW